MSSIQPLSTAAFSALIWEIDPTGAEALYGPAPFGTSGVSPTLGRLAAVLELVRTRILPQVVASMNTSEIVIVRRGVVALDADNDPLGVRYSSTTQTLKAVIAGPTVESMEAGLLEKSDYEVLIPVHTLSGALATSDAIRIDYIDHDIVGIRAHPKTPSPVAYRYLCKRAA